MRDPNNLNLPPAHNLLQEVSTQSGEAAMSSDLAILAAAASQLFECTCDMSREAVVALLSGLRDVRWMGRKGLCPNTGCQVGGKSQILAAGCGHSDGGAINCQSAHASLAPLALRSMRNIPTASAAVGQVPKLFALNRMVEVLLYNIGRIYDLWAIFLRWGWQLDCCVCDPPGQEWCGLACYVTAALAHSVLL